MEQQPKKTYFYANTLEFNLPTEFIVSRNKRYIHVINCRCLYEDCLVGDAELHASFVQRNNYFDGFITYTNTYLVKYKKYEFTGTNPYVRVWFTDMDGNKIDVDKFKLELMLEY